MKVLVCGATGFIGRRLCHALVHRGHAVVAVARHPERLGAAFEGQQALQADFAHDVSLAAWLPRLQGVDAVVNAVGIFRESHGQRFQALHIDAPMALFDACVAGGVARVVQVSALGADELARSAFHLSKRQADEYLLTLPLAATVAMPALVYGPGGGSAALFEALASLPVIPLPAGGAQPVQPLHVDDLVQALCVLLEQRPASRGRLELVGPQVLALREYVAALRRGMHLPPPRWLAVPHAVAAAFAALAARVPSLGVDREALGMLERGSIASPAPLEHLLGRPARRPARFIDEEHAAAVCTQARLRWLLPPLRGAIAVVWIVSGVLSFGVYPAEESYAMLARLGAGAVTAPLLLCGAAALDVALGIATLRARWRGAWLWWLQIVVMLGYTALITWRLPEYWLHPFGPVLKNLPMLAAIGLLLALERPSRTT